MNVFQITHSTTLLCEQKRELVLKGMQVVMSATVLKGMQVVMSAIQLMITVVSWLVKHGIISSCNHRTKVLLASSASVCYTYCFIVSLAVTLKDLMESALI